MRKGQLERAFAHCIRQCMAIMDGTVANLYLDETTRLKSPQEHKLDEVGGVDGMRVIFSAQVADVVKLHPVPGKRVGLSDRHAMAMRMCDEHLKRLGGFGQQLTERNAPQACQEMVFFLSGLHLCLVPQYTPRQREEVAKAYWNGRDPATAIPGLAVTV
jgi:hypothetical protein